MPQRRAILFWLLLVLPIVLAATPRGAMHAAAAPVGFVELCSEGRSLIVALDAEGRPVHQVGGCDDCAICCGPALAGSDSAPATGAVPAMARMDAAPDRKLRLRHPALCAAPRGPPLTESA